MNGGLDHIFGGFRPAAGTKKCAYGPSNPEKLTPPGNGLEITFFENEANKAENADMLERESHEAENGRVALDFFAVESRPKSQVAPFVNRQFEQPNQMQHHCVNNTKPLTLNHTDL